MEGLLGGIDDLSNITGFDLNGASIFGTLSLAGIFDSMMKKAGPVIKSTMGLDINIIASLFIVGTMVLTGWRYLEEMFWSLVSTHYTCSIRIMSEDAMFAAVMEYLEENRVFETEARPVLTPAAKNKPKKEEICLPARGRHMAWYAKTPRNLDANLDGWADTYWDSDSELDEVDPEDVDPSNVYMKSKKKVKYAPTPAYSHYFYFKPTGHTITVMRIESSNQSMAWWRRPSEVLTLSVYGRSPAPLKQLLQYVVQRENQKDVGRTTVYKASFADGANWARCFSRAARPIETVVLDEDQRNAICEDISEYLLPATSKWYANRGLPYRRGYLLYGPPGTGKTSLTVALAGKYGLRVYSLSLAVTWMSDDVLASLFASLPKTCIVLLEDVDACGVTRESSTSSASSNSPPGSAPKPEAPSGGESSSSSKPSVTFSGLLNAIDGVASKEGRILIMTTNHRNRLDEALIRPGRVDLQIKFDYTNRAIVHGLFTTLYNVDESDREILRFPADFPDDKELATLATEFAAKIPEGLFSPAEVQGLLLKHKKEPRKAVANAEAWVETAKTEKRLREQKEREAEKARKEQAEKEAKEARAAQEKEKKEKDEQEAKEKKEKEEKEAAEKKILEVKVNGVSPEVNGVVVKVKELNGEAKVNGVNDVNGTTNGVNGVAAQAK